MNTLMWSSPFTAAHMSTLYEMGVVVLPPIAKKLACGDTGVGAMAEPAAIAEVVQALLQAEVRGRDRCVVFFKRMSKGVQLFCKQMRQ